MQDVPYYINAGRAKQMLRTMGAGPHRSEEHELQEMSSVLGALHLLQSLGFEVQG
jgi:hypothetical protein